MKRIFKKGQMSSFATNRFLLILLMLILGVVILIWMGGLRLKIVSVLERFFG